CAGLVSTTFLLAAAQMIVTGSIEMEYQKRRSAPTSLMALSGHRPDRPGMSANDPNRSSASRLIVTDPRNSVLRASRATGDDSTGSCQSLTQPLRREDMSRNAFGTFICALCCLLFARAAWADGAVYAMTNALGNNEIKAFHRAANGSLSLAQTIAT